VHRKLSTSFGVCLERFDETAGFQMHDAIRINLRKLGTLYQLVNGIRTFFPFI